MRLIDADVLMEILTNAIRHMQSVAKILDEEDDPEIQMEIKSYTDIANGVKNMPTIEPQRWIPCSERLPEDEQNVLVTYKTTDKIHVCQYHDDGSRNPWYSYIDQCRAYMNVVLAWMPLPAPYRKEGER